MNIMEVRDQILQVFIKITVTAIPVKRIRIPQMQKKKELNKKRAIFKEKRNFIFVKKKVFIFVKKGNQKKKHKPKLNSKDLS